MQRAIGLIVASSIDVDVIERLLRGHDGWSVSREEVMAQIGGQLTELEVRLRKDTDYYVLVGPAPVPEIDVEDYMENTALDPEFRAHVSELSIIVMMSNSLPLLKRVIVEVLEHCRATLAESWMDDDFGNVRSGGEVLSMLSRQPDWDLRFSNTASAMARRATARRSSTPMAPPGLSLCQPRPIAFLIRTSAEYSVIWMSGRPRFLATPPQ